MQAFQKIYASKAEFQAEATGRVNLIGEHTDYNGGFVLPTLIPQKTIVHLKRRTDAKVFVASSGRNGSLQTIEYQLGEEKIQKNWGDYIQGLSFLLRREAYKLQGFEALIESSIPMGAGLSSSAALLIACARVLRQAFSLDLDDVKIARYCQRVENEFVGARVGIMDQMAISVGDANHALFLDTHQLSWQLIALPWEKMALFVINSGVHHQLMSGEGYNARRAECEVAARLLQVPQLRELETIDCLQGLPEKIQKRARHVISENLRVKAATEALLSGDMPKLGELMQESQASMRDDFEISVPELDILVEESMREPEVFGARLTGGGFGGSIVGICRPGHTRDLAERIVSRATRRMSSKPTILVPEAGF